MEKIIDVYQTDEGTRIEYEDGSWTSEDPVTCVMCTVNGRVYFLATEHRGERTAKAAFVAEGRELRETAVREFPEGNYVEIIGWALGALVHVLGGWARIWETFEAVLYPDA